MATLPLEAILAIPDPDVRSRYLRAHLSAQLSSTARQQTISCRACDLRNSCTQPTPHAGPAPAKLAIVAPYPSPWDEISGRPLSSPEEQELLSRVIPAEVGVSLEQTLIVHAIACRPSRVPLPSHFFACRSNLEAALAAANAPVVLLLGDEVTAAMLPGLRLQPGQGVDDKSTGRVYVSTYHPVQVARQPRLMAEFVEHLALAGGILRLQFVLRALDVFRADDKWPGLIDQQLSDLDPRQQDRHKSKFISDVVGASDLHPAAVKAAVIQLSLGDF